MLCLLLEEDALKIASCECLLMIVSRKVIKIKVVIYNIYFFVLHVYIDYIKCKFYSVAVYLIMNPLERGRFFHILNLL